MPSPSIATAAPTGSAPSRSGGNTSGAMATKVGSSTYSKASGTSFAAPLLSGTAALCIDSGRCPSASPLETREILMTDAADYNTEHPEYGFAGDPLRPLPDPRLLTGDAAETADDPWYGYLVRTGLY